MFLEGNKMQEGALVEAKKGTLGTGIIVGVRDDMAFVYFRNQEGNDAKKFRFAALQPAGIDSDPELESLKFSGAPDTGYSMMRKPKVAKVAKAKVAKGTKASKAVADAEPAEDAEIAEPAESAE